jgi:hypothetical protein
MASRHVRRRQGCGVIGGQFGNGTALPRGGHTSHPDRPRTAPGLCNGVYENQVRRQTRFERHRLER